MELTDIPPFASRSNFVVGVDVGQSIDPTAIAAVEHIIWQMSSSFTNTYRHKSGQWLRDANVQAIVAKKPQDTLNVRALKRLPLAMSYPQQCQLLAQLLSHPQLARAPIFLDRTGAGRGISDLIRSAGIKHVACTITGARESCDDGSDKHHHFQAGIGQ